MYNLLILTIRDTDAEALEEVENMSTWISKKGEDAGGELPAEEKFVTSVEGDDLNRKDSTRAYSQQREILKSPKSTIALICDIERIKIGKAVNGAQVAQNTENTAEPIKDDDASSATGGADSGPASLEGSPSEDKEGQQAFSGVSTKALASAKTLGGFLYSAVNKAGKTVVEAGAKIKKTVEENHYCILQYILSRYNLAFERMARYTFLIPRSNS
ncbi:hypothetical protein WN51_13830 [Melipona quadrifasciata]|uniref:Uncharacterized protein n=1 Tax=Melipona quadrifasciata TaxID=166423 RepID=A0A0N1ITI1_9HYME|nr:hypothetical protein WN51_13830 [Melipona quadrifasciata]